MKLIVGLGNPGKEYENTRHNVGFLVIDTLAKKYKAEWEFKKLFIAELSKIKIGETEILLAKPQTFMNLSGKTIAKLMRKKGFSAKDILVLFDDGDLDFGKVRFRDTGSSGGQRGMQSIIELVDGGKNIDRLKIGIGRIPGMSLDEKWVLGKWDPEQKKVLPEIVKKSITEIEKWLNETDK